MPALARRMWHTIEPVHAQIYFSGATRAVFDGVGLKGGWMSYFAGRVAPMGPVPAEVVVATFYNFAPGMVRRSIPDAWTFAAPEAVTEGRYRAADAALAEVLGDRLSSADMAEAAGILRRTADACAPEGRPLYAANAALPWPDEPRLALWHACTVLREHRGDGHVAALVAAGLDGCEAHVTAVAAGNSVKEAILPFRGWTEDEWAAAADRLRSRGWLDGDGSLTETGAARRASIERRTDELAVGPWRVIGEDACARLEQLLRPAIDAIVDAGAMVYPNPIGLPRPS